MSFAILQRPLSISWLLAIVEFNVNDRRNVNGAATIEV
jgi:hypothetical protein